MEETIIVTEENLFDIRIDKYISDYKKLMSRSQLKQRDARFYINSKEIKYSHKVSFNEEITIKYADPVEQDILPEKIDLDIIYEDDNVIVINKEQGMIVHPAEGNYSGTLVNALLFYLKNHNKYFENEVIRPGIVHRLDKDTSGVIIVAKNVETHEYLSAQFRDRKTEKKYLAIVKGRMKEKKGIIDTFITRDKINRKKFTADKYEGKHSITEFKILKEYKHFSLTLIKLHTGRTHQIRVHMSHIGNPVLGDPVYSRKDQKYPDATLMLHAFVLCIDIPGKGRMQFSATLPERFKILLREN